MRYIRVIMMLSVVLTDHIMSAYTMVEQQEEEIRDVIGDDVLREVDGIVITTPVVVAPSIPSSPPVLGDSFPGLL